jgi:hypothetical protein
MSDAAIVSIVTGAVTIICLLITNSYQLKQSKANGKKADDAAGQAVVAADKAVIAATKAEEAKTAATETNRKQNELIIKTDQIHESTNGGLEKVRMEFKEEIRALKEELKESHAKSLALAEASIPNQKSE